MSDHEYRWTGDHAVVIDGHTTPEGTGVLAEPGQNFKTVDPLDTEQVPNAVPVPKKNKTEAESDATTKETP